MNLEGRMLGNRYEILEKIGNGGMAMVYKAKCHVLNRFVAVKILRDEFTTDEEFIKRFSIEAQAAASITHPNIVSVFDVGKEGNLYYIVMELIQGKTLKEIITEEGGPLPWKWSVNIAIQIASALETAHKNNIVHRDIKPHNIIITEDGIAKVTDFGIAKAVSNSTITAFGATIGSVHYFSPEHARGGFTDSKSDIYSLGIVMYEMLTGRVPFDADTPVSVALKHMQEEPKPAIEVNPKIPEAINDIIMKAIRKDTTLRYQTATEMLRDLNRALKNPNGDFVDNKQYEDIAETQKIPTMNNVEIKKETRKKQNFFQKHKGLTIFMIAAVLFVVALVGTIVYMKASNPAEVILPDLVSMSKEDAINLIKERKLELGEIKEEYNGDYAEGYIASQDPKYQDNYNIKEGTKINLVVSLGIEEAIVPKVEGMTQEEAIEALEEANLKYEIVEEESKKVEAGIVISQETDPKEKVNAGDTVVIHVSTGVKMIEVPSVIGDSESSAKSALKKAGLKAVVSYDEDTTKDNGTVLKQSVEAGKEVEEGTSVTITVNKFAVTKSATLNVNVKSILNGKYEKEIVETDKKDEAGNPITEEKIKDVKVKITVNEDTVYNETIDPTTTSLVQSISGKGTVTVKVYIDDVIKKTKDINLNEKNKLTIE
ncbi:MAG: Stk1 family PASTA domain-containing Ser/Thr kinase [Clostridia bacterium]|nr:Stk1 family PASTA domain-containing Ser/Thr kinase [Clostridia bacterium]